MLDIDYLKENKEALEKRIKEKGIELSLDELFSLDEKRRKLILEVENLRAERNIAAQNRDIEKGKEIKEKLGGLEEQLKRDQERYDHMLLFVPSIEAPDTPVGKSDEDNVEVFKWGEKPKFDFDPKDHTFLGKSLDILDLEKGAKVGGYRGYYVKNEGVMLIMAIMMYALNKVISVGYKPMIPPTLVKGFALFGSGYFKGLDYNGEVDEIYQVASSDREMTGEVSKDKKFLIGTAEPSLLAYYSDETLNEEDLPIRVAGFSQCYRSEIGSYGKDTKGIFRVHEFMKVEQVVISKDSIEESDKLQEEMLDISKKMHQELGLPFRQLRICSGDLSAGKYKQYDLEAWMPGLNRYGETGSASNFLDWQSRRLKVKYKTKDGKKKNVFMLNNTALPTPRIFIAIIENFQQKDGSIKIPEILVPYTGFSEINPKKTTE